MFQDNGHEAPLAAPFEQRNLADEETPTAPPEHAAFAIVANPSADQPCTAGPSCTPTAPQEYADFDTGVNPSRHQSCTARPFELINLVNKATSTAMQEVVAAETSPEPPNVENSQLTYEAVLPTAASFQTKVMEVDDLSGCTSHNSVNAASEKVINLV